MSRRVSIARRYFHAGLGYMVVFFVMAAWMPHFAGLPEFLMLLGAVFMLLSSLGYAVAARLTGRPPVSGRLAWVQFWLVTAGLLASATALGLRLPSALLVAGALLVAAGSYAFLFNLWQSLTARPSI